MANLPGQGPRVMLSSGRDNAAYAVALHDSLMDAPGIGSVYLDAAEQGGSWEADVTRSLQDSDVLVCLLGSLDSSGLEPTPAQRFGLGTAAALGRTVIAVLVESDARTAQVPAVVADVSRTRVAPLRTKSWQADVDRIAELITAAATTPAPVDTLPSDIPYFVGREEELDAVVGALTTRSVNRVLIVGPGGVGKTALATVAAHRVAASFPDGRLYAQLGPTSDVATVLGDLLAALGIDRSAQPATLEDLTALYHSVLERRRVLLVLDDAESPDVVRALLPVGPGSAAVITSRVDVTGDPYTLVVHLGELSSDTALQLLRVAAGAAAVDFDEQSARAIVQRLGGLPLALRIAAARATRGDLSLAEVLADMTTDQATDTGTPYQLLTRVYDDLPEPHRRLFRLLGTLPTPLFEAGLAGALVDAGAEPVAAALRALAEAALIDVAGPQEYRLGDLAARFAADRLRADEPEADRRAAYDRAVRWIAVRTAFRPEMPITRDFWTADDTLGYAPYADAIASFIRHRGTRPPLTIGVTAPWGAGKTSLMRMVQERLDPRTDRERWQPASLRLSADARAALAPDLGGRTDGPVTNRELLHRVSQEPPETDDADPARLTVQPPHAARLGDDEWRPTVWFNPWMYQSGEQIWAGLAYEIITQVTDRLTAADRERFWLALNLRRVDRQALRRRIYRQLVERCLPWLLWLALAVTLALIGLLVAVLFPPIAHAVRAGAAALTSVAGTAFGAAALVTAFRFLGAKASGSFGPLLRVPNPVKAAADQSGKGATGAYQELFPDPAYRTRLGFLHLVQTDMRRVLDLIATRERPLVVFVDDLDRCSPGAVVQVIEAINLFLAGQFPNCVFVVAMEPAVVAAHVEAVYKDLAAQPDTSRPGGWSTLGWRFLEKIVQLPLSLPPPDGDRQTRAYLDSLLEQPTTPRAVPLAGAASPSATPATRTTADRPADPAPGEPAAARTAPPAATAETAGADRAARVRALEAAIRRRRPTTETLAAVAREAQDEVVGGPTAALLPETSEAANRVFVELYSDSEARTAVLAGVPGLASDNPRELKRFVNLFRFYSFIAQQQQLQGLSPVSGDQLAKLAVLAIRWPHLLGLFGRRSADGPDTHLARLEQSLRSPSGTADAWREAWRAVGLPTDGAGRVTGPGAEQLRAFLATEPSIATVADRML